MKRRRVNDPDYFCYIFGEHIFGGERMAITELIKQRYYSYFQLKVGDQEKSFAPQTVCKKCVTSLSMWESKDKKNFRHPWPGEKNVITVMIVNSA